MNRALYLFFFIIMFSISNAQDEVYELRTYQLAFFQPHDILHDYFEKALIPALNRQGVQKVGVFEEMNDQMPKKLYLLIPYSNLKAFSESKNQLANDDQYQDASEEYFGSVGDTPFADMSTNLIQSSHGFPNLTATKENAGLFELRIYESPNEDALRRKVKMFDDHEFDIFDDVGLPMLFFGYNIAGEKMPCLTYMLAFKDMDASKNAWAKFGPHPEWQRITKLEKFQNTMNDITRVFLKPLSYSQI